MRPKRDLTQGPILPHLLAMSIPMTLGFMAHMILNMADGIFVSRLGLDAKLAVLNYGFPFYYIFFAFFNGIATGTTATLARLVGANKLGYAQNVLGQVIFISLGCLALALFAYPILLPLYLSFQGATPESAALTGAYLNFMLPGLGFSLVALLLGSGLRAEGNMKTLMKALMIGTAANLILDPFFIFSQFAFLGIQWSGFGWGVQGAGAATAIANAITLGFVAVHYWRGKSALRWLAKPSFADWQGVRDTFRVGVPSIMSQALIGINLVLLTWLARPFGDDATAAIGIGARLDTLAVFPAIAIMAGVLSLVGQNFGARQFARVERSVVVGLRTSFIALASIGVLIHFLRGPLINLFNPGPETFASASHYVGWLSLGYAFMGLSVVASGSFQGLGRGVPFLAVTTLRLIGISLPLAFILSRYAGFGEKGIHFAPFVGSLLTGTIATIWILRTVRGLGNRPEDPAPEPVMAPAAAASR